MSWKMTREMVNMIEERLKTLQGLYQMSANRYSDLKEFVKRLEARLKALEIGKTGLIVDVTDTEAHKRLDEFMVRFEALEQKLGLHWHPAREQEKSPAAEELAYATKRIAELEADNARLRRELELLMRGTWTVGTAIQQPQTVNV